MNPERRDEQKTGWGIPVAVVVAVHLAMFFLPVDFSEVNPEEKAVAEIAMVSPPQPEPAAPPVEPEPEPEPPSEPDPDPPVEADEPEWTPPQPEVAISETVDEEELAEEPVEEEIAQEPPPTEERPLAELEPLQAPTIEPELPRELPSPTTDVEAVEPVDWSQYGSAVMGTVQSEKNYPRMAQRRGWEGTATVRIRVSRDGSLVDVPSVVESSAYDLLDDEALRMIESAAPFDAFPDHSKEDEQEFVIPIRFELRG